MSLPRFSQGWKSFIQKICKMGRLFEILYESRIHSNKFSFDRIGSPLHGVLEAINKAIISLGTITKL